MAFGCKMVLLRENRLLRLLPPHEIDLLAQKIPDRPYCSGQFIFQAGEPATEIYVLKKGSVVMTRPSLSGREKVVSVIRAGDLFGELVLAPGLVARKCHAQATEDCLVCKMPVTVMTGLMMRHPTLALEMMRMLAQRVVESQDEVERLSFESTEARVAEALLNLGQNSPEATDSVSVRVTHEQLARMVGASRETVTGILGKMRRRGALSFNYGTVSFVPQDLKTYGALTSSD